MTPLDQADQLLAQRRPAEAVALVERAAAAGNAHAWFRLALWRLIGDPLPRDLPAARAALRHAVAIGQPDAALFEIALTANGSGAPADWPAAFALLQAAAPRDDVAAQHLALLQAMDLDPDGMPRSLPEPERLAGAEGPCIFRALLSPAECRHVAIAAGPLLEPSVIVDPVTGRQSLNPIRTSHGAVLGPTREDLVIQAIQRRLAAISGTAPAQGEPFSVLRYTPGQEYRPHVDTLPRTPNQRIMTAIAYLNHGYVGGETEFPLLGVRVAGRLGDVLLFRNVTASGAPDPRSQHAGLPLRAGTKWIATRWIRERPYDPWNYVPGA